MEEKENARTRYQVRGSAKPASTGRENRIQAEDGRLRLARLEALSAPGAHVAISPARSMLSGSSKLPFESPSYKREVIEGWSGPLRGGRQGREGMSPGARAASAGHCSWALWALGRLEQRRRSETRRTASRQGRVLSQTQDGGDLEKGVARSLRVGLWE